MTPGAPLRSRRFVPLFIYGTLSRLQPSLALDFCFVGEQVVRNHPDYARPYTGITALKTGEVAYDAAAYLAESEQRSCAIAAGCFVTVGRVGPDAVLLFISSDGGVECNETLEFSG